MKITGIKELLKLRKQYINLSGDVVKSVNIMYQMAENAGEIIRERNTKGIMLNGRKFPKYSAYYARYRAGKGRNLDTDRLTFTGKLMQNMQADKTVGGAKLYFRSSNFELIAEGNNSRTPFFGLRKAERSAIFQDAMGEFKALIKDVK